MSQNSTVIEGLKSALANTYAIYFKTQNYHWNVTGPSFYSYHKMLEEQYQELEEALDKIAERIRALDEKIPDIKTLAEYTTVDNEFASSDARAMVKDLYNSHLAIIKTLNHLQNIATSNGDLATENFVVERLYIHQKTAWMLKATLD